MPDTAEYLARIRERTQGKDALALQAASPQILSDLIAGKSDRQLRSRPAENKWSVGEILAHLAEDEISTAWRYRQMVEHNGLELRGFDQDMWARLGDYASRSPKESLELFRLLRMTNLQFLRQLNAEQWECFGIHAERGRISVRDLATHMAGHDANHIEQVRAILK